MKRFLFIFLALLMIGGFLAVLVNAGMLIQATGGGAAYTNYENHADVYAFWYFEESSTPWDNGEGTAARDLVWTNGPTQDTGDYIQGSSSAHFAAVEYDYGGYTPATGDPGYDYTDDFTMGCWVQVDDQTADRGIMGLGRNGTDLAWAFYYDTGNDDFEFGVTTNGWGTVYTVTSTQDVGTGWYFVVIQFELSTQYYRLFVGDASTAVTEYSTDADYDYYTDTGITNGVWIGLTRTNDYQRHDGNIDECWIIKDILTETEINEIRLHRFDGSN